MKRRLAVAVLLLVLSACAERPFIGVEVTNSPYPQDCIPGSATRPCR